MVAIVQHLENIVTLDQITRGGIHVLLELTVVGTRYDNRKETYYELLTNFFCIIASLISK